MAKRPKELLNTWATITVLEKRILMVSSAFFPGNSPRAHRTTELAKELCRQGHHVTVLTPAQRGQNELAGEYGITMLDLGQPSWPAVPIDFHGKLNLVARAVRRLSWILFCYPEIELSFLVARALSSLDRDYDALISIAAPHAVHWGVERAMRSGHKPARVWVADCGDPFMGQENDSFSPAFYFSWAEKAFCRRADWITVPTEGAKGGYYPEFLDKLVVIPQGFKFDDYANLAEVQRKQDGVVRFAFAGLFIPGKRDPRPLLDYLVSRQENFEFHVFTKSPTLVEPYARQDSRIILRGFIPRHELLFELAGMDFLLNIENAGQKQTPSKLIDYWLCRRPILNIRTQDFEPTLVSDFISGHYDRALRIENPDQYRIENVARRFVSLLGESDRKADG